MHPNKVFEFPVELKCPVLLFKPRLVGHSHIYSALDNLTQHRVAVKRYRVSKSYHNLNHVRIIKYFKSNIIDSRENIDIILSRNKFDILDLFDNHKPRYTIT